MSVASDSLGLFELSRCAHALGMAFAREAEAAADEARKLRYFELFDRCFHGYRVAVVLRLRLAKAVAAPLRPESEADDLRERDDAADPPERDGGERDRIEYDRDRERETASLPILLKTLNGVAHEAERLPGPPPAELPTLRELLARMAPAATTAAAPSPSAPSRDAPSRSVPARSVPTPSPASRGGVAVLARPPTAPPSNARSRLLGSATTGLPGRKAATGPP